MKIAIYSGSFNPIHNGHLAIAREALKAGIDELWFVVSPHNPLKNNDELWPETDRLAMVRLALEGENRMKASDYEFHLPRPSYTIDTLYQLKNDFPQHQFILLIGGDNLANFHKWRKYEKIIEDYGLIVYPRPGHHSHFENHPNVRLIDAPLLDISSTEIRRRLQNHESIDQLVPEKAAQYIYRMTK